MDCVRQVVGRDGIQGLYRGFTITIPSIVLYRGMYFGLYDTGKKFLFADPNTAYLLAKFMLAQTTTLCAGIATYPLDTIQKRLVMQAGRAAEEVHYSGFRDCAVKIWKEESYRGFYKGLGMNLTYSIGSIIFIVLYDVSTMG